MKGNDTFVICTHRKQIKSIRNYIYVSIKGSRYFLTKTLLKAKIIISLFVFVPLITTTAQKMRW